MSRSEELRTRDWGRGRWSVIVWRVKVGEYVAGMDADADSRRGVRVHTYYYIVHLREDLEDPCPISCTSILWT